MTKICRNDINGVQLSEGDIIAECKVGELIWGGKGIVETRPLGIVVTYEPSPKAMEYLQPEETDCYNITPIRKGRVKLTEKADGWMANNLAHQSGYSDLNISRYDGDFYAWDSIEKIGSVYDLDL